MNASLVGIDRRVRLEWLDAVAERVALGDDPVAIRRFGHDLLRGEFPGDVARGKTLKVLLHFWVHVPASAQALRDEAIGLWRNADDESRRALHWGLGVATYPYWADAAAVTGRLLALGETVAFEQIHRRLAERWGQRPLIFRTARHVIRTWVDWNVLYDTRNRGIYLRVGKRRVHGAIARWLIHAALVQAGNVAIAFPSLQKSPMFFPFDLDVTSAEIRTDQRFLVERDGLGEDLLMQRTQRTGSVASPGRLASASHKVSH
jgi:hypothetical protein